MCSQMRRNNGDRQSRLALRLYEHICENEQDATHLVGK